jgi:membrane fusion protein, multidrug efflux system
MKMRYFVAILGLLLVIGGLAATKFNQISMLIGMGKAAQAAGPPPETVATALAEGQIWSNNIETIGSVVTSRGVTLSNDSPGVIVRLAIESGATVKAGQLLLELDTSVERAQLASIAARRQLAEISTARTRALVQSGALAQAQLDSDEAAYMSLKADEAALSAQIARKSVRAPFAGRLGLRSVNLGQYLAPGTPIAELESTNSTYVDFTLPQAQLPAVRIGMPVRAYVEGNGELVAHGEVSAIEPALDASTRNFKVRASIRESNSPLSPGMFLRVALLQQSQRQVTAIPMTAVVHAAYGDSVFCVESKAAEGNGGSAKKKARQQFVKLGEPRGDYVAVLDGVSPGQEIVTAGAFKLRNGMPLTINNDVRTNPSLEPHLINR